eukprot:7561144-Lingulodinium_polyedra.AAC.1
MLGPEPPGDKRSLTPPGLATQHERQPGFHSRGAPRWHIRLVRGIYHNSTARGSSSHPPANMLKTLSADTCRQ